MKKTLSIIMALALLISSFAMSTSVMAEEAIPVLTTEQSVSFTAPPNGSEETAIKVATFTPEKSGCYVFECTTAYENRNGESGELPGGIVSADLIESDYQTSVGFCFFADLSSMSEEEKKQFEELGLDVAHFNIPKFTAELEAGKTYYITAYQDGADDYTTELTVAEHTHTLKAGQEEKVVVNKDGTSDEFGGIYDECEDWFCAYLDYTTVYKQIEKTTVKNAVYTGKAVKPAVIIKTVDGKKLNSKYYTVTYKNNKKIGKGTAVIKFKNGYTGTVKKTFKINPKATKLKKVTKGAKKLTAKFAKKANVTGYQVQVATNKGFTKNKKTVTVKGAKKTKATVKKLKGGKKYYVRVRTYKKVGKTKYYSSWSKAKTVTIKK